MYIKDGYDGRDTVSSAPDWTEFNMCGYCLRPRRAYLLKNREGWQLHTAGNSQCAHGQIDTPVHCQICGGLSPESTDYLNG